MKQSKQAQKELMIDGKSISEWAKGEGWIEIGNWQCDPKQLSIKWINEILEFEKQEAKRRSLQEFRDILNEKNKASDNLDVIVQGDSIFIDAEQILIMLDTMIEGLEHKSVPPRERIAS